MGSTSFLGFSCPNLLLVFLIGTCYYIFSRKCWDFLWVLKKKKNVPYYKRSEFLIVGDGKNITQKIERKKKYAKNMCRTQRNVRRSFPRTIASSVHAAAVGFAQPTKILLASDIERRPRRGGVRLAYRDSSGER